jgi:amino acid permease
MGWVGPMISALVLIGFFAMLGLLLSSDAIKNMGEIKDVLFTLLGILGAAFSQVVNYWLGSSRDSAERLAMSHR